MQKEIITAPDGTHYITFGKKGRMFELHEAPDQNHVGKHDFEVRVAGPSGNVYVKFSINAIGSLKDIFLIGLSAAIDETSKKVGYLEQHTPCAGGTIEGMQYVNGCLKEIYADAWVGTSEQYGGYKNPVPSLDDKYVSRNWGVSFTFPDFVDRDEAVAGIQGLLDENGGNIPPEWICIGKPKYLLLAEPQEGGRQVW